MINFCSFYSKYNFKTILFKFSIIYLNYIKKKNLLMSSLSWTKDSIQDQEYQNFFETFSNNESYINKSLSSSNFFSPEPQNNRSASEIPANYINLLPTANGIEIE